VGMMLRLKSKRVRLIELIFRPDNIGGKELPYQAKTDLVPR